MLLVIPYPTLFRSLADASPGNIGNRFRHSQAPRGRCIQKSHWSALADTHRLARVALIAHRRHRAVSHGDLPEADHLIPGHHPGDRAIADRNQKTLAGHRWVLEYPFSGVIDMHIGGEESQGAALVALRMPVHFWRFSKQHGHG